MFISIVVLVITLILLFALPTNLLPLTGLYVYSVLLIWRRYRKQFILLDIIVFSVYLAISVIYYIFGYSDIIANMGTIFYALLGVFCILGGIFKLPLTVVNIKALNEDQLNFHRILSIIMGIMYLPSFVLSLTLFPKPSYIYFPLIMVLIAIPVSIILTKLIIFFTHVSRERKQIKAERHILEKYFGNSDGVFYVTNTFVGKEVVAKKDEQLFLETLRKGYITVYEKSRLRFDENYKTFFSRIEKEYQEWKDKSISFVVIEKESGKCVATMRLVIDEHRLPLENYTPFSLDNYRKLNIRIAEAGRFTIVGVPDVKKKEVLTILYQMFAVKLLSSDIELIFVDALKPYVPIYKKLGFATYPKPYKDKEFEIEAYLCCFNFAYKVIHRDFVFEFFKRKSSIWTLYGITYILRIWRRRIFRKHKTFSNNDVFSPLIYSGST